ncbi:MAG TPA: hypothetical protein VNH22_09805 [Blastocatellia bacterium]|jgi:hypothetical protein|nr:hypothetical protein [Blastocatellia bacterium]
MPVTSNAFNRARNIAFVVTIFSIFLSLSGTARMQGKKPITKQGLVQAVKINGLSTQELVAQIKARGVAFKMTADDENDLLSAGARPEIVDAARSNYRAESSPASSGATAPRPAANVPSGPPLSKGEIVTLLQNGVAPSRVEQLVEVRGVAFSLTPDITKEITSAGGNRSLLGAITERATAAPANSSSSKSVASAGPDYDEYTDQAMAYMQANDSYNAILTLQKAVRLDSSKPTAYQLLGIAQLYGNKNIASAETSMRAAIERGGAAVFRVYHDHDKFFNTYCQGSLFITKTEITFKADDGKHTFEATDSIIKEAKLNGFVGSEHGAFHLKVIQADNKSKTYNFAPATTQKAESNLIINLFQAY